MVTHRPYKKAVILGAAGFIGVNLSHALAERGFDLVCFDRVASPHWPISAKPIIGDFASMPTELLSSLDRAAVFHLVSSSRPSSNTANAGDEVCDLVSTIRYLEETKSRELRWIFVSSGGTVYGHNEDQAIEESAPTRPICSYGVVKVAIEQYFSLYRKLHGTDYIVARLANPYGPWQHPLSGQGIVAALIYKGTKGYPMDIWGDGENVRDYIYVADAVDGLIGAATGNSGEVYNIGTGMGISINQLIRVISETLQLRLSVNHTEARSVDVRRNVLNSSKLSAISGWRPTTDMANGIKKTASWINLIA